MMKRKVPLRGSREQLQGGLPYRELSSSGLPYRELDSAELTEQMEAYVEAISAVEDLTAEMRWLKVRVDATREMYLRDVRYRAKYDELLTRFQALTQERASTSALMSSTREILRRQYELLHPGLEPGKVQEK